MENWGRRFTAETRTRRDQRREEFGGMKRGREKRFRAKKSGEAEETCPQEWGHGSLKGYATKATGREGEGQRGTVTRTLKLGGIILKWLKDRGLRHDKRGI